jgi:hypothetical protein
VAELGNLTGGILLSLWRMSTVKIRARSLFRTPVSRIGAGEAGSGIRSGGFPKDQWSVVGGQVSGQWAVISGQQGR